MPVQLNRRDVVAAAVDYIDTPGVVALTLRRPGAGLGVEGMRTSARRRQCRNSPSFCARGMRSPAAAERVVARCGQGASREGAWVG